MRFLNLATFLFVYMTYGQDSSAKIECKQFDNDEDLCNSHTFSISGYGEASCVYVGLTSLTDPPHDINQTDTAEHVCLPDHCGLFVNDAARCQDDLYCVWEDDDITPFVNISRCYPGNLNFLSTTFFILFMFLLFFIFLRNIHTLP